MKSLNQKARSWKSLVVTGVLAAAMTSSALTANACSRWVADTDHGIAVIRTYDWADQLGAVARVHPVGEVRVSSPTPGYENTATWTVKHHAVSFEEHDVFHGTAGEVVNDKGMSVHMLYLDDSKHFVADHEDTGAPALSLKDVSAFIAETYASVDEAVAGFEAGEFQFAWRSGIDGAVHGLHVSVVDTFGDIALFQLNEGGEMVVHRGDQASDLRIQANAPLQQDHRAYVRGFALDKNPMGQNLPSSISSPDRNLRLLWVSDRQNFEGLSKQQTMAVMQQSFDNAAGVPADLVDPMNGETYRTWVGFKHFLQDGTVTVRGYDTATEITFNIEDTKGFNGPVCADLIQQASEGNTEVTWRVCEANS
ncbi:choloylglycine hydrolase [Aliiruegeria haliotis]|uniref:Choloylglycine hydrolase n=1 Tax=Aliiruegeria haliotis TaxID=1280846 RepID=A0A2T0RPR5_9RHOB|nr:choloylglycine hydrolase [Aliiruegeria haliotis]PRY23184.1 choloylglycine hydrolase [Aliiruegeria haliotis]